jgi:hypothetical protein
MPPYPVNSCVRPTTGVQPAFTPVADFVYVARCTGVTLSVWAWHAWLRHEYCTLRVSARRPLSDSILDRRDSDARAVSILYIQCCGCAARRWRLGRVPHRRNRPGRPTTKVLPSSFFVVTCTPGGRRHIAQDTCFFF